jgi:signal transduction histidine kinase
MAGGLPSRQGARWAESLQGGTLQGLVAMRMLLQQSLNRGSRDSLERAAEEALQQIELEIGELRGLIDEMRTDQRNSRFKPRDPVS